MRNTTSFADDDEEQRRVLEALLGHDTEAPPRVVELPEVTITADRAEVPQHVSMSADEFPTDELDTRAPSSLAAREKDLGTREYERESSDRMIHPDAGSPNNDWLTVLGLLVDSGFNKGRDAGNIVANYAQSKEARAKEERQNEQRLAEIAARRSSDPLTQMLAMERLRVAQQNANTNATNVGNVQTRSDRSYAEKTSPDSKTNTTAVEVAKRKAAAGVEGRETEKNELKDLSADTVATISGARTTANTESKNQTPPAITPAEQAHLDLQTQQLDEAKRARALAFGERETKLKADATSKYNKDLGDMISVAEAAKKLKTFFDEKRKAGATDMPGIGMLDSRKPSWASSKDDLYVQNILAQFANPGMHELGGTAISPTERPALEKQFGNATGASEEQALTAIDEIYKTMGSKIRGGSVGREDLAREVLKQRGLDDLIGVPRDAPQSAVDALPQTGPRPTAPAAGDSLGVVGGKARATSPSGQTKVIDMTPQLKAHLESQGWKVDML